MFVAIATCRVKPEPDPDEAPLVEALSQRGMMAQPVAWDDSDFDWRTVDVCVIRSTWNYIHHPVEFLSWLTRVELACTVHNRPDVVRWNIHKSYLRDLARRGIPVVPTVWIERGESVDLEQLASERGWLDVVVKPAIGAASFATRCFTSSALAAGTAFLNEHARDKDMMVQPYLSSVERYGERSLVWIDGSLTHAVRRDARFSGGGHSASDRLAIADDERRIAEAALAPVAPDLLYARVDLVRDDSGSPVVMELELVEPSLYLVQCHEALERFADAISLSAGITRSRRF